MKSATSLRAALSQMIIGLTKNAASSTRALFLFYALAIPAFIAFLVALKLVFYVPGVREVAVGLITLALPGLFILVLAQDVRRSYHGFDLKEILNGALAMAFLVAVIAAMILISVKLHE